MQGKIWYGLMVILLLYPVSSSAYHPEQNNKQGTQIVYIYYSFFEPRCDECLIVEKALVKILNNHYNKELKNKQLVLKMIDLSSPDAATKQLIRDLRIRRQVLLVVKGDIVLNMTRDAFRYAEKQYDLFSDLLRKAIDQALSQ